MASQDASAVDDGAETVEEPVILSVQDERKECRSLGLNGNITLKPNDTWYPVDFRWYQQWTAYTQWDKKDAEVDLENLHELGHERPGPIDNTELFDPEDPAQISLKKELSENETHVFVHSDFWERFMKWYGGGPAFPRDVVARGTAGMDKRIDMYPQFFNVVLAQEDGTFDEGQGEFKRFPKDSTMQQVADKIGKSVKALDSKPIRLYTKLGKIKGLFVSNPANKEKVTEEDLKDVDEERLVEIPDDQLQKLKMEDLSFDNCQLIVFDKDPYPMTKGEETWQNFEVGDTIDAKDMQKKWYQSYIRGVQEADGVKRVMVHYIGWDERWDEWMEVGDETLGTRLAKRGTHTTKPYRRKAKANYQSSYGSYRSGGYSSGSSWSVYKDDEGASMQKGIVGLRNLGNTCFMNSTIQCLAQSPILTEYFLKGTYKGEINPDNPLGWKGQVANAWADLVTKMFSNSYRTIAPREFKHAIGTVAPRFMGYSQQDSQELLSFLLDGLHEDLNRILNKPYTEPVESDGRADTVVANHAWKTYLMRNQSIIVDVLQGQYKSTVVCPDCGFVSITFDPYMFLSVPLPTEKYKNVTLTFCDLVDPNVPPRVYGLKILKIGDMRALKQEVATKLEIPNKDLYVCDVWKNKIHKVYTDHDMVQDIRRNTDDIWVIRSPCLFAAENYFEDLPEEPDEERAPATASRSSYYGSSSYSRTPKKAGPWKNYFLHCQWKPPPRQSTSFSRTYTTSSMDEVFGAPNLLTLPTKVPVSGRQVRERIMELLTPYLRDATLAEQPFTFNMQIGYSKTVPLPDTDEPLDLQPNSTHTVIRFVLQWENKEGYKTEIVDERERDESAGEAPAADSRGYSSYSRNSEARNTAPIDLFQCFDAFTEQETLSENDAWRCKQCQDFKCANKKIDLWSSPDLLVIHLKRFSYTRLWRDRINTLVNFPLEGLDLSPYVLNPELTDNIYDLYAVSNHMGGLGGGHYTAYAKSLENGDWYHLDDSRTSPVANPENVVSSSAYVLYYRKRKPYGITHRASLYHIPDLGDDGDDTNNAD